MNHTKKRQGNPMYQFLKDFTYQTFLVGHEKPSKKCDKLGSGLDTR
jgi:hypothetical protein